MKQLKQKILLFLGNHLLTYVIRVLCKTVKIKKINSDAVEKLGGENKNFVLAFWHGTMTIPWFLHRNKNFGAIVSQSKDGKLLSNLLEKWNYKLTRGSSHKGGKEALGRLLEMAGNNYSIAITPDGPTGPVFKMKPGAVVTAKKSGIPLLLMGVGYKKFYEFRSWDNFKIPKLFSEAQVIYSDAIIIPEELDYDATNEKIIECEKILNELQIKASTFA